MDVIKRDARRVKFDSNKIEQAILSAFLDVDGETTEYAQYKSRDIAKYIQSLDKDLDVEEIQNIVEEKLMASDRKDVARSYIIYRNNRTIARQWNSKLNKEITKGLLASDVQNQNANVDERSFGGRIGAASDAVNKDYALNYCMSEMSRNNHLNNEIYVHDLNSYPTGQHNCLSVPFDDLLANGFNTRQTDVRPSNSINTAFQLVAVIFQLQSLMQFGGVSATHLDWTMVPYVRKSFYKHYKDGLKYVVGMSDEDIENHLFTKERVTDISIDDRDAYLFTNAYEYAMDMTKKELKQAVEGMFHNLNY